MDIDTYYWHGEAYKNEFSNLKNLKNLKIATAYISNYGIDLLKEVILMNKLKKVDVEVFLSPEFSYNKPSEMLNVLRTIANTYLVISIPFHAKVVLAESIDLKNKVMFGSSNFTEGGIERNIEFDLIRNLETTQENEKFKLFFDFCRNNSQLVNQEIINSYLGNEAEFEELNKLNKKIKKKLVMFKNKDDSFDDEDYDLKDYFFQFEDYEAFFYRNEQRKDKGMMQQRTNVREKMLEIHEAIYNDIQALNLHCHRRKGNITSLIIPSDYNKKRVGWLGVRYGKSPKELDTLNSGAEKDEELGFQKHACLQFSITKRGFEINLFHAVPKDAFDRNHVHGKFENKEFLSRINDEIRKLKGNNLVWYIYEDDIPITFEIDNEDDDKFIEFYKNHDLSGRESFLSYSLEPDDPRIKNLFSIAILVKDKIKLMLPLYKAMSLRF
ncbi:MAG: phospholipase D family protein [Candidatus Pristimantibacillus sp.]